MNRKLWIAAWIVLAGLHAWLCWRWALGSMSIVMTHFDTGEPFSRPESVRLGLAFTLFGPYFLFLWLARFFGIMPSVLIGALAWIFNSLLWGLAGAYLISRLNGWWRRRTDAACFDT